MSSIMVIGNQESWKYWNRAPKNFTKRCREIVWLLCGIGYFHRLGWCGFSQAVFTIWWWFLSSVLGGKTPWRIMCLSLLWIVQRERNARIFEDTWKTSEMMWDLLYFYVSFWAYCIDIFKLCPLSVIQLSRLSICTP